MNEIDDLLPFYALDALTAEETTQVEAYLATHPEARAEVTAWQESVSQVAEATPPAIPAPGIRTAVLQHAAAHPRRQPIATVASAPSRPAVAPTPGFFDRLRTWWAEQMAAPGRTVLTGASLALAALALIWAVGLNRELGTQAAQLAALEDDTAVLADQLGTLQQDNDALRSVNTRLQEALDGQEQLLIALTARDAQIYAISGTEFQAQAEGRLIADPVAQTAVLTVRGLTPLPENQTYQFWFIGDEGPVSAGLLTVDPSGRGLLSVRLNPSDGFTAIGVSVEPAGGSPSPMGDIVMLGNL